MSPSRLICSLMLAAVAACDVSGDLGSLARSLRVPDGGVSSGGDAGCPGTVFDPLWGYELGMSSPVESAWFIPTGEVNAPSLGAGITHVVHGLDGGGWLWITFEAPVADGPLPLSFGPPSCADNTAVLFDPTPRDGGFFERAVQARVQVLAAGTDAGDRVELTLSQVQYDDPAGAFSLADIHIAETLEPWIPPAGEPDGGP